MICLSSIFLELSPHACIRAQSCPTLCNPMTAVHHAPLSMEFSRQEYWSRLPFPTLGDILKPGMESTSLASAALAGGCVTTGATWELHQSNGHHQKSTHNKCWGRCEAKPNFPHCWWGCNWCRSFTSNSMKVPQKPVSTATI